MVKYLAFFFIGLLTISVACEPEYTKLASSPNAKLVFSDDTVIFDTILTFRTSITKRFRVYNPNQKAVLIDRIALGKGAESDYSIIVNGEEGENIENIKLFGGDSLMVLVRAGIERRDEDLPYLVKDSVIVNWGNNSANVKLVSWGQDAHFLVEDTLRNEVIWSSGKPYVIYGDFLIDTLASLTVNAGTSVYVDNFSRFLVKGTLKILGDSIRHVTFSNTRFDQSYKEAPGQWEGIYFLEGSHDNEIRHAVIENATTGLRVNTPDGDLDYDVALYNTTIRHMSQAGILAFTSDIYSENTLIYNAGTYLVAGLGGGNYHFEHCTFVNSPNFFMNDGPAVQFADNLIFNGTEAISVYLKNSIVWDANEEAILLNNEGGTMLDTSFIGNIIKSSLTWPANYSSSDPDFPGFLNPSDFDYQLDSLSFARNKAVPGAIKTDLKGKRRDTQPDIGAYEKFD